MKDGDLFAGLCPICHLMSHFSEADRHLLNARKELLLAIRELIDKEIERIERKSRGKGPRKAKRVRLT
ncbi:MAG: hypothetical protein ACE5OP_04210 [Candidatus Glassbacteria bacterium]